ncbi:MAG: arginine N-succinyltransferase [Candidatus Caenarcaniphilales bacterium]|jgi:arginine N-succinyltransferase|nr:arginine N-succinyltransferase [Candidatus Caenarcaniphilales bacterium]
MLDFVIRPIEKKDLDAVMQLAAATGPGMTSLPADQKLMSDKIQDSINSFLIEPTHIGNESYRFVLELIPSKRVIGIAAIRARVGGYEPFYSYEIKEAHHQSPELAIDKTIPYLELCKSHDGPTIISSLFVLPEYRGYKLGILLSKARFLFMANFPKRFTDNVIAEMRGVINNDNKSPFWEGTVRHFFDMDFTKADYLSAKDKVFIADLMPKYPIYIPLLPKEVQKVISQVHKDTEAAMSFLESEGFSKDGHVDIFDAGPRIVANVKNIKTVRESKLFEIIDIVNSNEDLDQKALASNCGLEFRASVINYKTENQKIIISKETSELLNLKKSNTLRLI